MANTLRPYLTCIRNTLTAAINLSSFSCEEVERYGRPEVEFQTNEHAMMNPVLITRNEREMCLIESSINSVRVSVKIKQADDLEELLAKKYVMFLQQRADSFKILRRKPVPGFDLSFLITDEHLIAMDKTKVVSFLVQFLEDIDKELSALKLSVNTRGRAVAAEFLKSFK